MRTNVTTSALRKAAKQEPLKGNRAVRLDGTGRISLPLLGHANPWALLLAKEEGHSLSNASLLSERYALKSDEKPFLRELLRRKRNVWAFRCDQRRFAGDFVVVDMSEMAGSVDSSRPASRAWKTTHPHAMRDKRSASLYSVLLV